MKCGSRMYRRAVANVETKGGALLNLAALFDKFKKQIEDFEATGGVIKNPNHIKFDIESQIMPRGIRIKI